MLKLIQEMEEYEKIDKIVQDSFKKFELRREMKYDVIKFEYLFYNSNYYKNDLTLAEIEIICDEYVYFDKYSGSDFKEFIDLVYDHLKNQDLTEKLIMVKTYNMLIHFSDYHYTDYNEFVKEFEGDQIGLISALNECVHKMLETHEKVMVLCDDLGERFN